MFAWLRADAVIAVHDETIAEYGGLGGLRDRALLESALARPQNLAAYGQHVSVFELAAAYAVGIARNHPFLDGNKRTAYQSAVVFLELHGYLATPPETEVVELMLQVAPGQATEKVLAAWFERHSTPP